MGDHLLKTILKSCDAEPEPLVRLIMLKMKEQLRSVYCITISDGEPHIIGAVL